MLLFRHRPENALDITTRSEAMPSGGLGAHLHDRHVAWHPSRGGGNPARTTPVLAVNAERAALTGPPTAAVTGVPLVRSEVKGR
jgi:hypothetical protein